MNLKIIFNFFAKKDGDKITLRKTNCKAFFIAITFLIVIPALLFEFTTEDQSVAASSFKEFIPDKRNIKRKITISKQAKILFRGRKATQGKKQNRKRKSPSLFRTYRKKQVLIREDVEGIPVIPAGKKMIAKFLNALDTRFSSEITAAIPFAVVFKGKTVIPANSILTGAFTHPTGSERVFVFFKKCVLPDGREFPFKGQALDSSDYRIGIIGDYHSKSGSKIAKSIALGLISPMAETLTQKEALGNGLVVTPKSTLSNALLQGVSKSTQVEAKRRITDIKEDRDYLTVASGKEIIVSLQTAFTRRKNP